MRLVGKRRLQQFCDKHTDARKWIENWVADVTKAKWRTPQDVRDRYASVNILDNNTLIFNVKGNAYRLEVVAAYQTQTMVVCWIGTHTDYDKRNKAR